MRHEFFNLVKSPTRENYAAIRTLIINFAGYDPYSDDLHEFMEWLEQGRYTDLQVGISRAMPNLLLSPRAHFLASLAAEQTGDTEAATAERVIGQACLQGILQSGDGSWNEPYLVVRTTDEHDVLRYLELEFAGQALHHRDGRHFDVVTTRDGQELVFDISDAYNKLIAGLDDDITSDTD